MAPTATQDTPVVPPRPSKSQERDSMPRIPPRPINRRVDRSVSPNPDRFAPSPLNEGLLAKGARSNNRLSAGGYNGSRMERPGSVEIPSHAGEEGKEYESLAEQFGSSYEDMSSSPEQTRTIGDDVKLHAPKPSLPAQSAKQRVMQVTRTDSDRAASFGIGRPGSAVEQYQPSSNRSLKKKASTTSQLSTSESHVDDEHGIPEIGQQVPMFPNAGDVQAPSPAPGALGVGEGVLSKNHKRRTSARGNLPPGSYGLHGHGTPAAQDKLEKAYFDKHPDLLRKEHTPHHYDRHHDFSMSSEDLNKIVRETASRGSGLGVGPYAGTPSDQVGWQAIEESVSRPGSSHPGSTVQKAAQSDKSISSQTDEGSHRGPEEGNVIHVDEPGRRRSVMFSDDETPTEDETSYSAPILAEDEVRKGPSPANGPAVEPRRLSAYDEDSFSRPSSRPPSRPQSLYKEPSYEHQATPLEDVEEYEPLFPEDDKSHKAASDKPATDATKLRPQHLHKQRFPSRDIWEDAPDSVHYTVEVSTPEVPEIPEEEESTESSKPKPKLETRMPPPRDGETPAQAFARHQEELAEREARKYGPDTFLKNSPKPSWVSHQSHLAAEKSSRPSSKPRFPSQDVWEDTPDSHMLETTVSTPQQDEVESPIEGAAKPELPERRPVRKPTDPSPVEKPAVPERPKKSASGDDSTGSPSTKPSIPERPKPQVPARPAKAGPSSGGLEPAEAAAPPKQKPAVPARPLGGKIAALQGSFLNDLNKKLGLGPQAPKKEEPPADEEKPAEEKAPLVDARKTRARGPQRRAPAAASKSPSPAAAEEKPKFSLGFSVPATVFEIDPEEEGDVKVGGTGARKESASAGDNEEKESSVIPSELPEAKKTDTEPEKVESVSEARKPVTETETKTKEEEEPEEKTEESTSVLESVKQGIKSLVSKPTDEEEENEKEKAEEAPKAENKSLVTNAAGETILSEQVKTDDDGKVEPVGVEQ